MVNKAGQKYWNNLYLKFGPNIVAKNDIIRLWIEKYFSKTSNGSCIEIGCYPGGYLTVFGDMDYELYGVDLTPKVKDLPIWLEKNHYKVGAFWNMDFLKFNPNRKFDVVISLGFIEHFTNWEVVLKKHTNLVKENGFLVIEAPNFLGFFQNLFHRIFDEENYRRHYIPAMYIKKWAKVLEQSGFRIVYKGYFGKFDYWVENQKRNYAQKIGLKLLNKYKPFLRKILPKDKMIYSPYGGIIAQKNCK